MSGGSETQTSQEPWEGQKPYLKDLYDQAQRAFQATDPTPYQGSLVANPTQNQLTGMNNQLGVADAIRNSGIAEGNVNMGSQFGNRATSGYYMQPAAMQFDAQRLMPGLMEGPMGQYMGPEGTARAIETVTGGAPDYSEANTEEAIRAALRPLERRMTEQILPQAQSQAIMQGAYGGSGDLLSRSRAIRDFDREAADVTAGYVFEDIMSQRQQEGADFRQLASLAAQSGDRLSQQIFQDAAREQELEFQDFTNRRNIMPQLFQAEMNAAQLAPQLQNTGIRQAMLPGQIEMDIGGMERQFAQDQLSAELQRHQMEQMAPWTGLQQYANTIYGSPSFTNTTQQQPGGGVGGAASGAISGAAMGSMLGPWGAAGGAVLGGLGGFF
jgi:hypothetical protein